MFGSGLLQPTHLILILVIVLIIFGPGKLPDVGKALGKSIKEFKSATKDEKSKAKDNVIEAKAEEEKTKNEN